MEKHYGFIYLTENLINGKLYIGQHKINNQKTLDPQYFGSGTAILDAINLYGKENFKREILYFCNSKKELDEMEIYFINEFDAVESDDFYNCASGGHNGNAFAGKKPEEIAEIFKKISESQKEYFKNISEKEKEEHNKKIKETWANKSKKEMEEWSKKQSEIQLNRYKDKKEREKISKANKKRFEDPKEREKISKANKGKHSCEKNGMYGKNHKEESIKKMIEATSGEKNGMSKSVYCKELNICFSYIKLAEKYCINVLNSSKPGAIAGVCKGKRNFTGKLKDGTKLTWKYAEDIDKQVLDKAIKINEAAYKEEYNEKFAS